MCFNNNLAVMCAERTKLGTAHSMVVNLAYIFNQMAVQTIANLCFLQQTERTVGERQKKPRINKGRAAHLKR